MNLKERLDAVLLERPDAKTNIITAVLLLEGFTESDIKAALKAAGLTRKRVAFLPSYLAYLGNVNASEADAIAFINGTGGNEETSSNVKAYLKLHMNTWSLANRIWKKVEEANKRIVELEAEREANKSDEEKRADSIALARKTLNEALIDFSKGAKFSKAKARRFHPDKVSYLKDEELTKAYTAFFQEIT